MVVLAPTDGTLLPEALVTASGASHHHHHHHHLASHAHAHAAWADLLSAAPPPPPAVTVFPNWVTVSPAIPIIGLVLMMILMIAQLLLFNWCLFRVPKRGKTVDGDEIPQPQRPQMGCLEYLTLTWINPLLQRASAEEPMTHGSMMPMWVDMRRSCAKAFPLWDAQIERFRATGRRPRFLPVFLAVFGWRYLAMGLMRLASLAISLCTPALLRTYLNALGMGEDEKAVLTGAGLVGAGLAGTLLSTHTSLLSTAISMELGGVVGCANFRRITTLSRAESDRLGAGFIQQCWSEDSGRLTGALAPLSPLSLPRRALYVCYAR